MAGTLLDSRLVMINEYLKQTYASAMCQEERTQQPPPSTWDVHQIPAASRPQPSVSHYGAGRVQCNACGNVMPKGAAHDCPNPTGTFVDDKVRAACEKHFEALREERVRASYERAKRELAEAQATADALRGKLGIAPKHVVPPPAFELLPPPKVLKCPHMVELVPKTPVSDFENTRAKILAAARREVAVSYREWPTCKTTGNPWEFKVGGDYVGREGWYNVSFGCMGCNVHED